MSQTKHTEFTNQHKHTECLDNSKNEFITYVETAASLRAQIEVLCRLNKVSRVRDILCSRTDVLITRRAIYNALVCSPNVEMIKCMIQHSPNGECILKIGFDKATNYAAFRVLCSLGYLNKIIWISQYIEPDDLTDAIYAMDASSIRNACESGNTPLFIWLLTQINYRIDLTTSNYLFERACELGNLETAKWVHSMYPSAINITKDEHYVFMRACIAKKRHIATWLASIYPQYYYCYVPNTMYVNGQPNGTGMCCCIIWNNDTFSRVHKSAPFDETCCICFDKKCNVETSCGHKYCSECIYTLMSVRKSPDDNDSATPHYSCPMCRCELPKITIYDSDTTGGV